MTPEEALRELFGTDVYDLTADGFAAAVSDLRRRSRKRAQQVERALEPRLLERGIFSRRGVPWHKTSQGLRARIALLPDNPHLERDIGSVREALGIPDDQLRAAPDSNLRIRLEEFLTYGGHLTPEPDRHVLRTVVPRRDGMETAAEAADHNLANQWLWYHRARGDCRCRARVPGSAASGRAQRAGERRDRPREFLRASVAPAPAA